MRNAYKTVFLANVGRCKQERKQDSIGKEAAWVTAYAYPYSDRLGSE